MGRLAESCILAMIGHPADAVGRMSGRRPNRIARCNVGDKSPKAADKKKKQAASKKDSSAKKK